MVISIMARVFCVSHSPETDLWNKEIGNFLLFLSAFVQLYVNEYPLRGKELIETHYYDENSDENEILKIQYRVTYKRNDSTQVNV